MMLAKGATVAVADGAKLNLFRNDGDQSNLRLVALPHQAIESSGSGSGGHQTSSANPDQDQVAEDGFSAGIVQYLNQQALTGKLEGLVVVAAPRALGEMRMHYHKALSAMLHGEIAKDLTGHSLADIEKAVAAA